MKIEEFSLPRRKAHKYWKQYVEACKANPKDDILKDMKKTYNQLKSGRKLIDITQLFEKAGMNENAEPKLAIAQASSKLIYCRVQINGNIVFQKEQFGWKNKFNTKTDVEIKNIFEKLPLEKMEEKWDGKFENYKTLQAPVPKVPASLIPKPKSELKLYHVLWEVDKWKPVPPHDPYLLRRVTPNMFVVIASWNLTPLEKAVMRGRI